MLRFGHFITPPPQTPHRSIFAPDFFQLYIFKKMILPCAVTTHTHECMTGEHCLKRILFSVTFKILNNRRLSTKAQE